MKTAYRPNPLKRVMNHIMRVWIRLGLPPSKYHLLIVRGRRSGKPRSTPVSVMVLGEQRWLVAPYGHRDWVKNARAAGEVTLRRCRRVEVVSVEEELDPTQCAPVLKLYINEQPITRPYFDATPNSPLEAFASEAQRHPVFRILQRLDESLGKGDSSLRS